MSGITKRSWSRKMLTFDQFKNRANIVHRGRYEYPNQEYNGNRNNILINCPIHKLYLQLASSHLNGSGCRYCFYDKRMMPKLSREQFIEKAMIKYQKYGDRYDYSGIVYFGNRCKIIINCKLHGSFCVLAGYHLRGGKCVDCK